MVSIHPENDLFLQPVHKGEKKNQNLYAPLSLISGQLHRQRKEWLKYQMDASFKLPKPDFCKTRHFYDDFWECQMGRADVNFFCPYALGFGHKYFCKHPNRRDFAIIDRASE